MLTKNPPEHAVNRAKKSDICRLSRRLLTTSLFLVTSLSAMADTHSQLPTTPCNIRLVFGSDALGMPSVGYKLSLQIRNRTARDIAGVSVYWLDDKSAIIGNSAAICGAKGGAKGGAVGPSESGPCEIMVQQIGGALLQRLGQATWTKIINHQLTNFHKVKQCAIIGYD
ncbi:MAG: hypothetical protein ACPHDN_03735, partial [Candidatus Puniceispirillaceae bacterium]